MFIYKTVYAIIKWRYTIYQHYRLTERVTNKFRQILSNLRKVYRLDKYE